MSEFEQELAKSAVVSAVMAGSPLTMPTLRTMAICARMANLGRAIVAQELERYGDADPELAAEICRQAMLSEEFQAAIGLELLPYTVEGVMEDMAQVAMYPLLFVEHKRRQDQLAAAVEGDDERAGDDEPYERRSGRILDPTGRQLNTGRDAEQADDADV